MAKEFLKKDLRQHRDAKTSQPWKRIKARYHKVAGAIFFNLSNPAAEEKTLIILP